MNLIIEHQHQALGAHKSGKQNPAKLMELKKLSKCQGNLKFLEGNLEFLENLKFCGVISMTIYFFINIFLS